MQSLLNNISKNLTLVNFSFRVNQSFCLSELPSAVEDIAEGGQVSARSNRQLFKLPGDPGEVIQGVIGIWVRESALMLALVNSRTRPGKPKHAIKTPGSGAAPQGKARQGRAVPASAAAGGYLDFLDKVSFLLKMRLLSGGGLC